MSDRRIDEDGDVVDSDGRLMMLAVAWDGGAGDKAAIEAVACRNALAGAGIEDPQAFVEAAKDALATLRALDGSGVSGTDRDGNQFSFDARESADRLNAALGSGTPETDTAKGGGGDAVLRGRRR